MRWIAAATLAAFAVSRPAAAATFVVDVMAPPDVINFHDGTYGVAGGANFPDVILHRGDQIVVNVSFGEDISPITYTGAIALNLPRYACDSGCELKLTYPFSPDQIFPDGFSFTATATYFYGQPPASDVFDINGVSYYSQPLPEPQTWVLFILGFGAMGTVVRSKRGASRSPAPLGNL
jgi:hypothetical protein